MHLSDTYSYLQFFTLLGKRFKLVHIFISKREYRQCKISKCRFFHLPQIAEYYNMMLDLALSFEEKVILILIKMIRKSLFWTTVIGVKTITIGERSSVQL